MPAGGNFSACGCGPDTATCQSPTQPVATVGVCLADGTPIAVTVVRDCADTTTSEGWINLTTGAWSAGAPPAGVVACGDSRSIQVSGTFCDIAPDSGEVLGLVLVEYSYAADGSIDGVRLVDAVTGQTYAPEGEVTTCPAGVEQPERDMIELCDVNDDESGAAPVSVSFLRDFVRDENGAITGHSDYTLDGEPYTPAGAVGLCVTPCRDCQTHVLCDAIGAESALVTVTGTTTGTQRTGTLANGVTWTSTANRATGDPENWWTVALYPLPTVGPLTVALDRPVRASWSAQIGFRGAVSGGGLVMPEGTVPEEIHPLHAWDPATRTLTPLAGATATDEHVSRFAHPGPVTSLGFGGVAGGLAALRRIGDLVVTPVSATFLRTTCQDCDGVPLDTTDTALDGITPYEPVGTVGVCQPETAEPCASTVSTLRLCDLDPNVEPDSDGKRCAVPFLRHLIHDCTGALAETRDTAMDGITLYTPVEVVDCGSGGVPAMVEVPWEVVDIQPDPESAEGLGLIYTLSPIDEPATVGLVRVTTSSVYNPASCPGEPPQYNYRNPTTYTFQPDQALRDAATYVRCDLIDFDTFEPVTGLTPPPSRLGGTAYWDGTTVRPTASNGTGEMYYDGPPEQWAYRVGNTGGGNSCSSLSFAAVSLRAEGCCSCDNSSSGSGSGSGRTVQDVCVIANAAPTVVTRWTRVIEDGGATIYYLDQEGARYDSTLPAGHQIVDCPTTEPEPCRNTTTVLLCDTEEEPTQPVPTEGEPTATDLVPPTPLPAGGAHVGLAGGGAALWAGGTLAFPPDPDGAAGDGGQVYRAVAATLAAARPACDSGTATITASVHVHLDGPTAAGGYGGALRLYDAAGILVGEVGPPASVPVGYDAVLTVTGDVPAADLAAGAVTVMLALETFQGAARGWTVDSFGTSYVFGASAEPCEDPVPVQFLRTLVTDCATGEAVSASDTTLDGLPYTVTGDVSQCIAAPAPETEDCRRCETLTLCDVVPDESPGDPEIAYETIPLAELGPAGSYGDGIPVSGVLPNGVTYEVNVGEWGPGQGHYTFYPYDGTQTWSFDQPVYLRFGLRGLNISPTECYVLPEGAVVESISPNHTWDEDSRYLCEITGQSSAADESVFLLGPVTELPIVASGSSTGGRGPGLIQVGLPVEAPTPGLSTTFLRTVCRDCSGAVLDVTDTALDGATPYEPAGDVMACAGGGGTGPVAPEPCRDTSSTLLCDTAATDLITVFDPANVSGSDGWEVVSFTGANAGAGPEAAMPYPAPHGSPFGYPALGARADQTAGSGGSWPGYDSAPVRWVLRKTFTAPEDGVAVAQSVGFRGDGGARVRINGVDAGMYGQWNEPATTGTAQVPVTAGPNTVEIEVRDTSGINNVVGRLDIAMPHKTQFMRRQTVDCETGEVIATHDTTLDGEPYEVVGEVGQCQPVAECCEQAPPEQRVDVETTLLCVRDEATGDILDQVVVERVYDDQSGDLVEQRLTDLDGDPYDVPAGAELAKCPSPDRITRQVCVVESGVTEFLTNAANAASGVDEDWQWSPDLSGTWYPMYRVAPNPLWTVTDTTPNAAHWVGPHADRTVCPTASETSPPVPATWYTRASWNLPADVAPESIRIAATVLNADNDVVQWRLNDGAWQPVGTAGLGGAAWTFPPTAVPGGRAGQNEVLVQIFEGQPGVTCPSPNSAGMLLHVIATYDHEPKVWTQVIEPGGQAYYLDENGDRQDAIPEGMRLAACGGGGDTPCCPPEQRVDVESDVMCIQDADGEIVRQVLVERVYDDQSGDRAAQRLTDPTTGEEVELPAGAELVLCQEPACPVAFSTECVGAVTRTEAGYDNTSLIGGMPGKCGSVQGPNGQFPCQPTTGGFTITSWIVDGEEVIGEGGGRTFAGGPCGDGTAANPGMHRNWALALTNLDPGGATWSAMSAEGCAWFVGSIGGTGTVYGAMTIADAQGQQWILGPAQACEEVQFTKVYTQECDGSVSVSWLTPQGVETDAPEGDLVPCGTGCGGGGGRGLDVEVLPLCDLQDDGVVVPFLRHLTYGSGGQVAVVVDTALDGFAPYTPTGTVGLCEAPPEPCRTTSTVELCDLAVTESVTVLDPTSVLGPDGWQVTSFTGAQPGYGPEQPVPYDAYHRINAAGLGQLSSRSDFTMGPTNGPWPGYEAAPMAWVLSKEFTLSVGGTARVVVDGFKGDHGARVRINGVDLGLYAQYNTPVDGGAFEAPVSAGANTIEIEDHDVSNVSYVTGRITITVAGQTRFLRHYVLDCASGEVLSHSDTDLDGAPYTVTGEIGQCTAPAGGQGDGGAGTPCLAQTVIEECRWDDTDGDGIADTAYRELIGVSCDGAVSSLGTYTEDDLNEPYTPVSPVPDGPVEGAEPAHGVQAHRIVLAAGESWDAGTVPLLQAVSVVARGTGEVTTADGTTELAVGESIGWSVARDSDAALTGPLVVGAVDGPVAVSWTQKVAL